MTSHVVSVDFFHQQLYFCRVPKGGVFKGGGGGNWGTLRIPREDWGTLGKIREPPPLGPPPLNNPRIFSQFQGDWLTFNSAKVLSRVVRPTLRV